MWVQPALKTSSKDWQRVRRWERGHSSALLPGKVGNPRVQHSLACTCWLQSIGSPWLSKSCFPCYSAECWGYLKMGQPNFNFQLSMSRSVLEDGAPRAGEEKLQSVRVPSEEWEGSLPWAGQLLWEHRHHRGCRFVFSAACSKTLHRWIQQVLVEWVLSIQRKIFTLPAGGTQLENYRFQDTE